MISLSVFLRIFMNKMRKKIIKIHDFEDRLKRKIRRHLKSLGYVIDNNKLIPPQLTKESIRLLHSKQRQEKIDSKKSFFKRLKPQIYNYFANGSETGIDQTIVARLNKSLSTVLGFTNSNFGFIFLLISHLLSLNS